jgi:hypothetical protein
MSWILYPIFSDASVEPVESEGFTAGGDDKMQVNWRGVFPASADAVSGMPKRARTSRIEQVMCRRKQ